MENASKALLIAGAILIAILLIAIGMMVYNSASGVVNSAASNMSSQEKQMFNKQWTIYEGRQSGSTVKALVSEVATNNANTNTPGIALTGLVTMANNATNPSANSVVNQSSYTVTCTMGTDGLVTTINIAQ